MARHKTLTTSISKYWQFLAAGGLSLLLRLLTPPQILLGTSYDDWLQVHLANNIMHGHWLGLWENRTLIKGAGYPIFLAICGILSISPIIVIHVMYLMTAYFLSHFIQKIQNNKRPKIKILFFTLLAFNPILYSADFSRIYRTSGFTLFIFMAMAFAIAFNVSIFMKTNEIKNTKIWWFALFAGMSIDVATTMRSDGIYNLLIVLPYFLLSYVAINVSNRQIFKKKKSTGKLRKETKKIVLIPLLLFLIFAPQNIIKIINYHTYGVNLVEDYNSGSFKKAIIRIESLSPRADSRIFVPISKRQIELAIENSPHFAEIGSFLTNDQDTWERQTSCQQNVACDNPSAWETYLIREAVFQKYPGINAVEFQNYFRSVAKELDKYCGDLISNCGPQGLGTGVVPYQDFKLNQIWNQFVKQLGIIMQFKFNYNFIFPAQNPQLNQTIGVEWRQVLHVQPSIWTTREVNHFSFNLMSPLKHFYKYYTSLSLLALILILIKIKKIKVIKIELLSIIILLSVFVAINVITALALLSFGSPVIDSSYLLPMPTILIIIASLLYSSAFKILENNLQYLKTIWGRN